LASSPDGVFSVLLTVTLSKTTYEVMSIKCSKIGAKRSVLASRPFTSQLELQFDRQNAPKAIAYLRNTNEQAICSL
jgi:hypothetical protein